MSSNDNGTNPPENSNVELETQTAAHADELFPVLMQPELYRFIEAAPPDDLEVLRARLRCLEAGRSPDRTEQWLNWAVRTSAGEVIGYVQATVTGDGSADIAFVLGQASWGKGHAYAASREMLRILVEQHGVTKVRASVDARNTRSVQLLKRLGLQLRDDRCPQNTCYEATVEPERSPSSHSTTRGAGSDAGQSVGRPRDAARDLDRER